MNVYDCYDAARSLQKSLAADGYAEVADLLRTVMAEGFTGTEILMGLRFEIEKLMSSHPNLSVATTALISTLLSGIEECIGD